MIKQKVQQLLIEHDLDRAPIPVEKLAQRMGAQVVYQPFKDGMMSGVLVQEKGKPALIGVNAEHSRNRQRFTIAHELGHLVMSSDHAMFVDRVALDFRHATLSGKSSKEVELEAEANAFAAELLMPYSIIEEDIERLEHVDLLDDDTIRELASKYQVSQQALLYRLINLGYLEN